MGYQPDTSIRLDDFAPHSVPELALYSQLVQKSYQQLRQLQNGLEKILSVEAALKTIFVNQMMDRSVMNESSDIWVVVLAALDSQIFSSLDLKRCEIQVMLY